jgi:hypothetical protein
LISIDNERRQPFRADNPSRQDPTEDSLPPWKSKIYVEVGKSKTYVEVGKSKLNVEVGKSKLYVGRGW